MRIKLPILLAIVIAGVSVRSQDIISWAYNNGTTIPPTGHAGVMSATNWNLTGDSGSASLKKNDGTASGTTLALAGGFGAWGIGGVTSPDTDGSYNNAILDGYYNLVNGTLTLGSIPFSTYDVYIYISSDGTNRTGTISDGTTTYYFSTYGIYAASQANAVLTRTTDTTGANPPADYALFTNRTSNSLTFTINGSDGMGFAGIQIVNKGSAVALLNKQNDTAITPNTVYVGGSAIFSATFSGTLPITNQWMVDTGSGYVNFGSPIINSNGSISASLTLTNLQMTNAGNYKLVASNAAGISNSTPATLTVLAAPTETNALSINVQFSGTAFGSPSGPVQTGSAAIGGGSDVWNLIGNPTYSTTTAGTARGTNVALVDINNYGTPMTMDYVGDYIYNTGAANPFSSVASPYANLMSGYMGSVTTTSVDTNTVTLHNLVPGVYDLYLYSSARSDAQTRVTVFTANGQTAHCGPNNNNFSLVSGVNYLHLTPIVSTDGMLSISCYGTVDAGQGTLNGFQLYGPSTNGTLFLTADTSCDSPVNDYVERTVTLAAAFGGNPAPALQWQADYGSGYVNIPNATNSTLTLTNLQITNSASYALFATNSSGSLNSSPFYLSIQSLPSPVTVNVQFIGSSYAGGVADMQVGGALIGSYFWNPISNPLPTGADTNPISGSAEALSDDNNYGTPFTLDYVGNEIFNSGTGTPFYNSGSPAAALMEAGLIALNGSSATVTLHGIPAGTYDLYLYSSGGNSVQNNVTRFAANDSFGTAGPNNGTNVLMLNTNYVHLTPAVSANGVLNISLIGNVTSQSILNGIQFYGPGSVAGTPVAAFTGIPTNTIAGQSVTFTDASSGSITNWVWNFGDGISVTNISEAITPHIYSVAGTYSVTLTVTGPGGSNAITLPSYIIVSEAPSPVFGSPVLSNGNLILNGTGGVNGIQYRILTTTNLSLPRASWIPVYTNIFMPDGSYSYTNSAITNGVGFFQLVSP